MARKQRLNLAGVPQHIIQRGNNRDICFASNEDFAAYAHFLKKASERYSVAIHAWVFMTNHVHLLATPKEKQGVSQMMQMLGRHYVPYFNYQYKRTGTLWEGRYKSCLVDSEQYLFDCYKYIELNPVRANMVDDPFEYRWSSHACNIGEVDSDLCTPHDEYLRLGNNKEGRASTYRELFRAHMSVETVKLISDMTQKGLVLGNEEFVKKIEQLSRRRAHELKAGRPKKQLIRL